MLILLKKVEHYKLKNIFEIFEIIYKNGKSNHKIW